MFLKIKAMFPKNIKVLFLKIKVMFMNLKIKVMFLKIQVKLLTSAGRAPPSVAGPGSVPPRGVAPGPRSWCQGLKALK